jgi:hypothetical protein
MFLSSSRGVSIIIKVPREAEMNGHKELPGSLIEII